jgi:hypothetical protein
MELMDLLEGLERFFIDRRTPFDVRRLTAGFAG